MWWETQTTHLNTAVAQKSAAKIIHTHTVSALYIRFFVIEELTLYTLECSDPSPESQRVEVSFVSP